MPGVVIVGAQWGDEGKGKIVDIFTEHADMVVRYAGGPNAGHTLVVGDEKVIVRLIPSGILRQGTTCVLAQGMVIDPQRLVRRDRRAREARLLARGRAPRLGSRARDPAVPRLVDGLREQGSGALGTTKRGIGPCYEDKVARRGVPMGALRDVKNLRELAGRALEAWSPSSRLSAARRRRSTT